MENKEKKESTSKINKTKQSTVESSENVIKKWLGKTSLTILLIAIIIVAYIGVNLLLEKANLTDIDLTTDQVYSLSDTSKSIVKSIEKDVDMILINMSTTAQSVVDFAYKYNKVNSKITIKQIEDVNKEPELASKYNLTDNSALIIIQSEGKDKILTTSDLYTWDYTTGDQKDITEEAITNALLDVTISQKPKIYYLTGHNKYSDDYMYYFKEDLIDEANEVEALDLLTKGQVPDDTSVLMITTLKEDITEAERDAILNYIKKGGKIILFSDPNVSKTSMTNFQKVLDEYGVSISDGIMLEQDTNKMISGSPSAIILTVSPYSSITNQTNMNMNACFMNAGKLTFKESDKLEELDVTVETLATTSEQAFYRSDLEIESTSKSQSDEEGSATVGALLTKKIDDNISSKLIVYANNMFITNVQISLNSQYYLYARDIYNNEDLAINSISYLTGRDDTITIRKNTETTSYTVTEQQQNIILTIIFAVPVVIVIAGIVVWQLRRRKK